LWLGKHQQRLRAPGKWARAVRINYLSVLFVLGLVNPHVV